MKIWHLVSNCAASRKQRLIIGCGKPPTFWASPPYWNGSPKPYPAANASGWPWAVRLFVSPRSFYLMSPCPIWMPKCGSECGSECRSEGCPAPRGHAPCTLAGGADAGLSALELAARSRPVAGSYGPRRAGGAAAAARRPGAAASGEGQGCAAEGRRSRRGKQRREHRRRERRLRHLRRFSVASSPRRCAGGCA